MQTDMGENDASRKPIEVANDFKNLLNKIHENGKFWHQGKVGEW